MVPETTLQAGVNRKDSRKRAGPTSTSLPELWLLSHLSMCCICVLSPGSQAALPLSIVGFMLAILAKIRAFPSSILPHAVLSLDRKDLVCTVSAERVPAILMRALNGFEFLA